MTPYNTLQSLYSQPLQTGLQTYQSQLGAVSPNMTNTSTTTQPGALQYIQAIGSLMGGGGQLANGLGYASGSSSGSSSGNP
jgi:hypothetical protein